MSFFSDLIGIGTVAAGVFTGNPALALGGLGQFAGSSIANSANNSQFNNTQQAIADIQQILAEAQQQELEFLNQGNLEAAAAIRAAAAAELEGFAAILDAIPGLKQEIFDIADGFKQEAQEFYLPFIKDKLGADAAFNYQNALLGLPNLDGSPNEFNADLITSRPSFKFREEQGFKAVDRSAAARTGSLGGRAIRESQRFASGLASQEFENEFQRAGQLANALNSSAQFGAQGSANAATNASNIITNQFGNLNSALLGALGGIGQANANEQLRLGGLSQDLANNRIQSSQNNTNALVDLVGLSTQSQNQQIAQNALSNQNLISQGAQLAGQFLPRSLPSPRPPLEEVEVTAQRRNTPSQNTAARANPSNNNAFRVFG